MVLSCKQLSAFDGLVCSQWDFTESQYCQLCTCVTFSICVYLNIQGHHVTKKFWSGFVFVLLKYHVVQVPTWLVSAPLYKCRVVLRAIAAWRDGRLWGGAARYHPLPGGGRSGKEEAALDHSRGLKYCCSSHTNCKVRNYLWSYGLQTLTNTILQYHQPHPSIMEWAPSTHQPAWRSNWLWSWNYSFDRNPPVSHIHIL